ncbi:MAG TPA: PIN domain-containing protein [Gaiellaceae bacterium]
MKAVLDTNVLVRHLTADPPEQAKRATAFLADAEELLLSDIVVAELVYALDTVYRVERARIAELLRAVIAFPAIVVLDEALLLRALELYEQEKLDFVTSYLAASAERSGVGAVASFYRSLERIESVQLVEPR